MNFISIGGWCGTKMALKELGLFNDPSLPFDSVRSSMEGIIDCIDTDFANFFPKVIQRDNRFQKIYSGFLGEYIGFYHDTHNLSEQGVVEAFERRFVRFDEKIKKGNCIFLRTIVRDNYEDELQQYKKLQEVLDKKYPGVSYIICFIIPNQTSSQYYKELDNRTFIFTLNNKASLFNMQPYQPIFDFIKNNDLFTRIPNPNNDDIVLNLCSNRLWLVDGHPMVYHNEK